MTNKSFIFFVFIILGAVQVLPLAHAQEKNAFKSTPYPVPRFVSLGSDKVSVRTGPGRKFPVEFVFKKKGLPVEVVLEYENWRKIKDHEGEQGWVHQSLISGKRTGVLQGEALVAFYSAPKEGSRLVARAEPGGVGKIDECRAEFCRFELSGYKGWVEKAHIWGAYTDEVFD